MKVQDQHLEHIAYVMARQAVRGDLIEGGEARQEQVFSIIKRVLLGDAQKERDVEEKAHAMLREHVRDIETGGLSYRKMFARVKEKLAKERNLVL